MNYYPFPDKKIWKTVFFAMMAVLLLVNRDSMMSMVVLGFYPCQTLTLGLIGAAGIAFLAVNRGRLKEILADRRMLLALASAAVLLAPMVIKGDWQRMYVSILACLLFGILVSYFLEIRDMARCYIAVLSIFAAYSLVALYVLRPLTDGGILHPAVIATSRGRELYHYGASFVSLVEVKNRNFGLFREPGVYQYFILLGLYLNNYEAHWKNNKLFWLINILLAVTMLSTFATGGVLELGLFVVVLFFDKKWYKDKKACILAGILVAAACALVGYCIASKNGLYWALYEMTMKVVHNPESVGARVGSIGAGVEIFFRYPLFGTTVRNVLHAVADNTSSTLILYGIFGILGGSLNVLAWFCLVWQKERKLWANFALAVILFMSFNTQNLTWNLFFWLFPMMALCQKGLPLLETLRKRGGNNGA